MLIHLTTENVQWSIINASKIWGNTTNTLGNKQKDRYMRLFETNKLDGTHNVEDMPNILKKL